MIFSWKVMPTLEIIGWNQLIGGLMTFYSSVRALEVKYFYFNMFFVKK